MPPAKKPATAKTSKKAPPWRKRNPKAKTKAARKLTPAQKSEAKSRAMKAGRPYPNLVDNMAVAKKANAKKRG